MLIGTCETCSTLRSEVEFLRARVVALQDKLTEMADPMVASRLAHAQRLKYAGPPGPQAPPRPRISPASIRRQYADRPPDTPQLPVETRDEIERGFQVS
jgi:hypothetical protein